MKNVKSEVGRSSYRKEKNELRGKREKAKKKHVESKCDEIIECHRTELQILMCTKEKILSWKKIMGFKLFSWNMYREYDI